ncbi:hypothetical protein ColTof4_03722 [Colletotrichum tofieldiae]|nr:hypothetical protein ColTof3_12851 [Colletotrichum tofieldiae]GKT71299.1 hypothetical protein ColTof4_03722 [Colletotrichum tofieldiae]
MSTQIPRPASNTTNSSNSTTSTQFTGNMDSYTLSMYEHTKRLMANAQIPYGSPASLLLATTPNEPATPGTGSGVFLVWNPAELRREEFRSRKMLHAEVSRFVER